MNLPTCVLGLALAAPPDLLPDGTRPVKHHKRVCGLSGFPFHRFLVFPLGPAAPDHLRLEFPAAALVREGAELPFFKAVRPRLYAVAGELPLMAEVDARWIRAHALAVSDLELEQIRFAPVTDPRVTVDTTWRVTGIEGGVITLTREDVAYDAAGARVNDPASPRPWSRLGAAGLGVLLAVLGLWCLRRRGSPL